MTNYSQLFVDDERDPGFVANMQEDCLVARNFATAIALLEEHWDSLSLVSLDHDLADFSGPNNREMTGYDVLCWIEQRAGGYLPPFSIQVHSMNPVAKHKMNSVIYSLLNQLN